VFEIEPEKAERFSDAGEFVETLNTLHKNPVPQARDIFSAKSGLHICRAPGRLDVMGGIADYSGSLVLELPTREATFAAIERDPERKLTIVSLDAAGGGTARAFDMPLADFEEHGKPVEYERARERFERDPDTHWASYAAGAFLVLMREKSMRFHEGARILISSSVPEAKGVGSSAALEVAVMQAACAAFDVRLTPLETALLCRKVENLVAGAPCGIMDQMTVTLGESHRLLPILCQPAVAHDTVSIPEGVAFFGLDSGIRHRVSGADYGSVRTGAFMGYRIIAHKEGFSVKQAKEGKGALDIDDPLYKGYLANIDPSVFEGSHAKRLPERIEGKAFLDMYGGITDQVTRVDPGTSYAIRFPTAHPVYENSRVHSFARLLAATHLNDQQLDRMGELMYRSHASYSSCGLGSAGTDLLVELVRALGPERGLYGAKITGGGSGGTVAVLGRSGAKGAIEEVAEEYERKTGHSPYIFSGSSPGASRFGCMKLNSS